MHQESTRCSPRGIYFSQYCFCSLGFRLESFPRRDKNSVSEISSYQYLFWVFKRHKWLNLMQKPMDPAFWPYFDLCSDYCGWVLSSKSFPFGKFAVSEQQQRMLDRTWCMCHRIHFYIHLPNFYLGRELELHQPNLSRFVWCWFLLLQQPSSPWLCL